MRNRNTFTTRRQTVETVEHNTSICSCCRPLIIPILSNISLNRYQKLKYSSPVGLLTTYNRVLNLWLSCSLDDFWEFFCLLKVYVTVRKYMTIQFDARRLCLRRRKRRPKLSCSLYDFSNFIFCMTFQILQFVWLFESCSLYDFSNLALYMTFQYK